MEESNNLMSPLERLFMQIPLGNTALGRSLIGMGAGAAIVYGVKPNVSFFPNGAPRPWIFTDSKNPEATIFPWWAFIVVPGALFGVLL